MDIKLQFWFTVPVVRGSDELTLVIILKINKEINAFKSLWERN